MHQWKFTATNKTLIFMEIMEKEKKRDMKEGGGEDVSRKKSLLLEGRRGTVKRERQSSLWKGKVDCGALGTVRYGGPHRHFTIMGKHACFQYERETT